MRPGLWRWGWLGVVLLLTGCSSSRSAQPGRSSYVTPLGPAAPTSVSPARPASPAAASRPAVPQRDANTWRGAAADWLGTPYRLGGLSRDGIDCSGFALVLHRAVTGRTLARSTAEQWRTTQPVNVSQLRPGDLLFFNTTGKGVSHVGVFMGGTEFAHASTSKGVMFSRTGEEYWAQRFLGARRP